MVEGIPSSSRSKRMRSVGCSLSVYVFIGRPLVHSVCRRSLLGRCCRRQPTHSGTARAKLGPSLRTIVGHCSLSGTRCGDTRGRSVLFHSLLCGHRYLHGTAWLVAKAELSGMGWGVLFKACHRQDLATLIGMPMSA
jgi:hypothetical protein